MDDTPLFPNHEQEVCQSIKAEFKYELQSGEKWVIYKGLLIVIHPERRPKSVDKAGVVTDVNDEYLP